MKAQNNELLPISPGGGIGRHAGLKILFPLGSAGSIPAPGTNQEKSYSQIEGRIFLF